MRAAIYAVVATSAFGVASAQPTDPKELYDAANQAMDEGRYADAVRDFTVAYEITQDPVLFYKIASAHEKAGDCVAATTYYRRYLDEAKPDPQYVALTEERLAACAAAPEQQSLTPPEPSATTPVEPPVEPPAPPVIDPVPAPGPAAPAATTPSRNKDAAWLLVGGALTFVTAGTVLAYSTSSAEQDIKDLYAGTSARPPTFDASTRRRYDDLVTEGERYETLSYVAFGLAGACAIGATVFFLRDRDDASEPAVQPVVTGTSAGVRIRF